VGPRDLHVRRVEDGVLEAPAEEALGVRHQVLVEGVGAGDEGEEPGPRAADAPRALPGGDLRARVADEDADVEVADVDPELEGRGRDHAEEPPLDPRQSQELIAHPLPAWVERMTTTYLRSHGGRVLQDGPLYDLTWPDGTLWHRVVFHRRDAHLPGVRLATLEDPRIRELTTRLPRFVPGQPIPQLRLADISPEIAGWFALFQVTVRATDWAEHRILPLFVHDDGRVLPPTARRIWDCLLEDCQESLSSVTGPAAEAAFSTVIRAAEEHGRVVYDTLVHEYRSSLERERTKGIAAFAARRRAINRIGLPAVRMHRLAELEVEERTWHATLDGRAEILPELTPILILRIEGQAT